MSLVLHFHPLSSYCHKVLIGLYERDTPFEARVVDLSQTADEFAAMWPTAKIPLLVDGERVVPETSIQLEYLDAHYPGPPMLPADPEARLEARLWDRLFDQYVMTPMQKIVADRMRAEDEKDTGTPAARSGRPVVDSSAATVVADLGVCLAAAACGSSGLLPIFMLVLQSPCIGVGRCSLAFDKGA